MPATRPASGSVSAEKRRIKLARLLDAWLGTPLVLATAHLRSLRRRARTQSPLPQQSPVRRILFIKLWGMGSVILSEPALRWLRKQYPAAEIHYLTLKRNRAVLDLIPIVSKVYSVSFESLWQLGWQSLKLVRELRAAPYDLVFDAEFFANCPALIARSAARRSAGRVVGFTGRSSVKNRIQDVSLELGGRSHMASEFVRLAAGAGASQPSLPRPKITLPVQPVDRGLVEPSRDEKFHPFLRQYLVVNVNASLLAVERRWPWKRFVQISRTLLDVYDADLVLIGASSEREYVGSVQRELGATPRVWNFCGALDVPGLAFLLSRARLVISNDSGPIHLASALGVPVVGFYGPETPLRYGPLGSRKLVFYENLWCSPCMHADNAKTVRCINSLSCMTGIDATRASAAIQVFVETHRLLVAKRNQSDSAEEEPGEACG